MSLNQFFAGKLQFAELALVGEPDQVLKGRHCSVACHQLAKDGKRISWFFSPDCTPVGRTFSPDTDEEWIANRISSLPNTDLFINFTSFDQVWHWIAYRDSAVELALCFLGNGNAPCLKKELEDGQLDEFSYNYILTEAKIYRNLWNLIKICEPEIKRIFEKNWGFPFDSVCSLFVEIVREDIEHEFCACLNIYHVYSASQIKNIAILKRKYHRGEIEDKEIKKLYQFIDKNRPFALWFNRLLIVAEHISEKNNSVKQYLNAYGQAIDDLSMLQCQREWNAEIRKKHTVPSHTWRRGQYQPGTQSWRS